MTETQKRLRRALADLLDGMIAADHLPREGRWDDDDAATRAEARRALATISEELRAKADG
jgi:hypothetical protein